MFLRVDSFDLPMNRRAFTSFLNPTRRMSIQHSDFEQQKDFMRAPWKLGDYGAITRTVSNFTPETEDFVERLKLPPEAKVLDVACGTGTVTIPLARGGSSVTGLDMMPHLLDEARAAAADEGLQIRFDEGFAEELPYPNGSLDVVVSRFGAMFSPYPEAVASEMARILKPGGLLAMANWTESGFNGRMSKVFSKFLPPRSGIISPMLWGDERVVCERFGQDFASVETTVVDFDWEIQMSANKAAEFFARNAGPFQLLLTRLDERGRSALLNDYERFWTEENVASDEDRTVVRNHYLQVLATRR
jgi:ubiquinone/menaquinone biosynthesis C-methylase UbiE